MDWLKSKTTLVVGSCLALIGLQGYGTMSMRNKMDERVNSVEREMQSMQDQQNTQLTQLASDLDVITKKMGITGQELANARDLATKLKQENARTTERLQRELATKADSKAVLEYRDE